ncbi:MAG: LysR family transcriptional regulator [Minicystis sp.]
MNGPVFGDLDALLAVADHGSFRAAAVQLGRSPSAVSHAVASLERRLGVRLFHRTTRSVALSEAGRQYLARVRPALREIADAGAAVDRFQDTPRGTLRINASAGAARLVLMPLVLEFVRRHPEMNVDLVCDDRMVDIVAEGFDAGVRAADTVPQDMVAVRCSPDIRYVVVGSKRYFARRPRPVVPADLLAHECVRLRLASGTVVRWEFERRGEQVTLDVRGRLILGDSDATVQAALAGAGLAHVADWSVNPLIASGRLIRVLDDWTPFWPGLCLYYPGHRHVPAGLRAFAALVRERTRAERGEKRPRAARKS